MSVFMVVLIPGDLSCPVCVELSQEGLCGFLGKVELPPFSPTRCKAWPGHSCAVPKSSGAGSEFPAVPAMFSLPFPCHLSWGQNSHGAVALKSRG